MDKKKWQRWVMQTATRMEDLDGLIQDTGIERIDREHHRLIEYVLEMGDVFRGVEGGAFDSGMLERQTLLFNRFLTALSTHFNTEEAIIDKYRLKGKKRQQQEHQLILQEFNGIFSDFREGILSTFQTVRINLISELVNHINGIDRQTFLLENFLPVLKESQGWDDVSEIIKSTGVPFVDSEHHHLTMQIIDFKNYLYGIESAIRTRAQKEKVLEMLEKLLRYTEKHFEREEAFLKTYHLSLENQREQHEIFLRVVFELIRKVEQNHPADLGAFTEYLFTWWVNHINGTDYVEFHFTRIAESVFNRSRNSDDFSWLIRKTGIEKIDNEHAHLIGMLLKLNDMSGAREDGTLDIKAELELIAKFAKQHFKHEEEIMRAQNVEGVKIHSEAHEKLLRYVEDAVGHAVSGRSQLSPALLKRMMRWWVEHTNGMDYDTFVLNRTLT